MVGTSKEYAVLLRHWDRSKPWRDEIVEEGLSIESAMLRASRRNMQEGDETYYGMNLPIFLKRIPEGATCIAPTQGRYWGSLSKRGRGVDIGSILDELDTIGRALERVVDQVDDDEVDLLESLFALCTHVEDVALLLRLRLGE